MANKYKVRKRLFLSTLVINTLTLSGLNLPLSSSSTTSRELLSQFSTCSVWRWFENYHVLVKPFHGNFRSKTLACRKIKSVFRDVKWCFNASWGLKGLSVNHNNNVKMFSTCASRLLYALAQVLAHLCTCALLYTCKDARIQQGYKKCISPGLLKAWGTNKITM